MLPKPVYLTLCRSLQLLVLLARGDAAKDPEILVLRQQLAVLRRQVPRPRLEPADQALLAAVSRALPRARWSCFLVRPETLMRWHRRQVARAWTYPHRQTGRPPLDQDVQQADRPAGPGELPLGLPAHPRRAAASWCSCLGHRDPLDVAASRARSGTATDYQVFRSEDGEVLVTPVRAPKANAFAERWVRTVRAECLDCS
jgi:hypothetical protein